jgi:hypothetical protein
MRWCEPRRVLQTKVPRMMQFALAHRMHRASAIMEDGALTMRQAAIAKDRRAFRVCGERPDRTRSIREHIAVGVAEQPGDRNPRRIALPSAEQRLRHRHLLPTVDPDAGTCQARPHVRMQYPT